MAVDGRSIVNEYDERYNEGYAAWSSFYPVAARDLRFFLGDQWSEREKRALYNEGRNAYVFNRIRPVINAIDGYQRKNRLSSVTYPVEDGDQLTADQMTKALMTTFQMNDGYHVISDAFSGANKTGMNLISMYKDFRADPVDGDIKMCREPWNSFMLDPYFTKRDLTDCNYILRRRYISPEMAMSLLPDREKDIRMLQTIGWERDQKFTWLPYQQRPTGYQMMAYDEYYQQRWVSQDVIVDTESGIWFDWNADREIFRQLREIHPTFELIKRQKREITMDIIVNSEHLDQVINPWDLDEYPFVLMCPILEPESDQYDLKVQSLINAMVDPQREANRRRSQMIDIMDSQINSGWIAEENAVINPQSLYQASQGKVIYKKAGLPPNALERLQAGQIPQGAFALQEQMDADIKEIAGVNDAAFGVLESGNETGVLTMLRQGAALTNLQGVFDALRLTQKCLSKKILRMIQGYSPNKIQRLIGEEPTEEFYKHDLTKYDVMVEEGMLTDSQKQMFFRQLLDLAQIIPMPPMMLAKAAPIQGKGEYLQELEQHLQQQQEAAQQQQEKEQALMQANMELSQSKALQQVAGAKERFTRAVANMGLQDERASEAVQNRNQATLDQVKAMKELDQMTLDQIEKSLLLTQLLNEQSKSEEEETKVDDVFIAQGAQQ